MSFSLLLFIKKYAIGDFPYVARALFFKKIGGSSQSKHNCGYRIALSAQAS